MNDGQPITLGPGALAQFPLDIAPGAPTAYHILVFRGRLGLEDDAVVGQVFAVPDVQITQESYDVEIASTCTRTSTSTSWPNPERSQEDVLCDWTPINQRVDIRLATNFGGADPTDPTNPAIKQIFARWVGSIPANAAPAPFVVDGTQHANGVWTRIGEEPHPDRLTVIDPPVRRDARLVIFVYFTASSDSYLTSATSTLATFFPTSVFATKSVASTGNFGSEWRVTRSRISRVALTFDAAFRTESVGGFPVPTSRDVAGGFLRVTETGGLQAFTDVNEVFTYGQTRSDAQALYASLELPDPPLPQPPDLHWSAVLTSLPLSHGVVKYRQAFVASGDPPPVTLTIAAREGS